MFYIVGLGNPGKEYENTRHNIGWMMLDAFIEHASLPKPVSSSAYVGNISEGVVCDEEVFVLYPHTYMNKSGSAVKKLVQKGEEEKLIVIYDDVDVPLGEIKISFGRGDGGHNGIKSIITSLGTRDFVRIRVGVARKALFTGKTIRPVGNKLSKHVLGTFGSLEAKSVAAASTKVCEAIVTILKEGREKAMNIHNI